MKKNLRKIISLVLILAMTLAISVSAFAASNNPDTRSQIKKLQSTENEVMTPSKMFIDYISDYFKNHEAFKVINKEQKDINEAFYQNNLDNYLKSDFLAIRTNAWNYVSCFCEETTVEEPYHPLTQSRTITPYLATTRKTISYRFYHVQTNY